MIQPATQKDLDFLVACANAAYEKYVARIGRKPAPMVADFRALVDKKCVYTIHHKEKPAGFIVLHRAQNHLHVENVAVSPAFQGMHLGRKLLVFAEEEAQRLGLTALELYTNEKMTENLSLYPKLGYQEIGRREENGFNRVYFRKVL